MQSASTSTARRSRAGNRVTYEVLLASFGLARDPALASIGAAVHFLDIGGISVPDASDLETSLTGLRQRTRSDDDITREAGKIFDLLYDAYRQQEQEAGSSARKQ